VPTAGYQISVPFMSVASFKAHPTFLDLGGLRSGDTVAADQDAELYNILLEASAWANNFCRIPLQAHVFTQQDRVQTDKRGCIYIYPEHPPVRQVMQFSYATNPGALAQTFSPSYIIEDQRNIVIQLAASALSWSGPLQLGPPVTAYPLFSSTVYACGFTATTLANNGTAGQSTMTVSDPTAIQPGDLIRIWEPGYEEAVYVASTWVPVNTYPPVATAIPLASPLKYNHAINTTVSGLEPNVHLAIANKAVDLLQRPGTNSKPFPGRQLRNETTDQNQPSSKFEARAMQLLLPYQDVR